MRFEVALKRISAIAIIMTVAVAVMLKSMDFSEYRDLLTRQVQAATGRDFVINGDVDLDLSLNPVLKIHNISLGNASWSSQPQMIRLKRLEVEIRLLSLISGNIDVERLVLISPGILLETDEQGRGNWLFGATQEQGTEAKSGRGTPGPRQESVMPLVKEIRVEDATLTYRNGRSRKTTKIFLEDFTARAADIRGPVSLNMVGIHGGNRFEARADIGSFNQLITPTIPFPLRLEVHVAETMVKVDGTIRNPMEVQGVDMKFSAEAPNLEKVSQMIGIPLPVGGPFHLIARLADPNGIYSFPDLDVRLGRSHLAGALSMKINDRRPMIKADLTSLSLDLDELSSLSEVSPLGRQGNSAIKETTETRQNPDSNGRGGGAKGRSAKHKKKQKRVFSNTPFPLEVLRMVNAEIKVSGGRILSKGLELKNLAMNLTLEDGNLRVHPLTGGLVGGALFMDVSLITRQSRAMLKAELDLENVALGPLLKNLQVMDLMSSGKADMKVRLKGRGHSMRSLMAGLNGKIDLIMGEGRVEIKYVDFFAAKLLKKVFPKEYSRINCLACRFQVNNGLAVSDGALLDTEEITVSGEGHFNLTDETLKLTIRPKPKDTGLLKLAVPVHIRGTFAAPSVRPDVESVMNRVIRASLGLDVDPTSISVPMVGKWAGIENPCLAALGTWKK